MLILEHGFHLGPAQIGHGLDKERQQGCILLNRESLDIIGCEMLSGGHINAKISLDLLFAAQNYEKNSISLGNTECGIYLCYVFFMVLDFISSEAEL
jgi:hypothetical protein